MIVSELITRCLRRAGIIDASRTPTDKEMVDGLDSYNAMVAGFMGSLIGQKCPPFRITGSTQAYIGRTYLNVTGSPLTLTGPTNPRAGDRFGASAVIDDITVTPNGFRIDGSASNHTVATGSSQVWWFEDEAANFVPEGDLAQSDTVPFSADIGDALSDLLTFKLATEYGPDLVNEAMAAAVQSARETIAARYGSRARNRVT